MISHLIKPTLVFLFFFINAQSKESADILSPLDRDEGKLFINSLFDGQFSTSQKDGPFAQLYTRIRPFESLAQRRASYINQEQGYRNSFYHFETNLFHFLIKSEDHHLHSLIEDSLNITEFSRCSHKHFFQTLRLRDDAQKELNFSIQMQLLDDYLDIMLKLGMSTTQCSHAVINELSTCDASLQDTISLYQVTHDAFWTKESQNEKLKRLSYEFDSEKFFKSLPLRDEKDQKYFSLLTLNLDEMKAKGLSFFKSFLQKECQKNAKNLCQNYYNGNQRNTDWSPELDYILKAHLKSFFKNKSMMSECYDYISQIYSKSKSKTHSQNKLYFSLFDSIKGDVQTSVNTFQSFLNVIQYVLNLEDKTNNKLLSLARENFPVGVKPVKKNEALVSQLKDDVSLEFNKSPKIDQTLKVSLERKRKKASVLIKLTKVLEKNKLRKILIPLDEFKNSRILGKSKRDELKLMLSKFEGESLLVSLKKFSRIGLGSEKQPYSAKFLHFAMLTDEQEFFGGLNQVYPKGLFVTNDIDDKDVILKHLGQNKHIINISFEQKKTQHSLLQGKVGDWNLILRNNISH